MIKPLNTTQLSSAKPRCGLQSISDLLPRLIKQYEMQAELVRKREEVARRKGKKRGVTISTAESVGPESVGQSAGSTVQTTFGW